MLLICLSCAWVIWNEHNSKIVTITHVQHINLWIKLSCFSFLWLHAKYANITYCSWWLCPFVCMAIGKFTTFVFFCPLLLFQFAFVVKHKCSSLVRHVLERMFFRY